MIALKAPRSGSLSFLAALAYNNGTVQKCQVGRVLYVSTCISSFSQQKDTQGYYPCEVC